MTSGVRNRIASYEAQSQKVSRSSRSPSPTSGSAAPGKSPKRRGRGGSVEQENPQSPPTAAAAQNRVFRMKQQQMMDSPKDTSKVPAHLMGKRKLIKERRMMQQKRAAAAARNETAGTSDGQATPTAKNSHSSAKADGATAEDEARGNRFQNGRSNRFSKKIHRVQKTKNKPPTLEVAGSNSDTMRMGSTRMAHGEHYSGSPGSKASSAAHLGSEMDSYSEANYAYSPIENSVDHMTDDDATLTSVRRVMAQGDNGSMVSNNQDGNSASNSKNGGFRRETSNNYDIDQRYNRKSKHRSKNRLETNYEAGAVPGVFPSVSSSDYDTDGEVSKTSRQSKASRSQATDTQDFARRNKQGKRIEDDDRTFDYGDRDEASYGSLSYEAKNRTRARIQSTAEQKTTKDGELAPPSSLINKADVEHYTKSLDSPSMKVGVGVVGALAVGCFVLGPIGLLAGAAAVGVGVGFMQIPEEEREKIIQRTKKSCGEVHEKAVEVSEKLSNSCVATYEESGVAEHIRPCLSMPGAGVGTVDEHEGQGEGVTASVVAEESMPLEGKMKGPADPSMLAKEGSFAKPEPPRRREMPRNKKVACLRNVRILPAGQIYGLDPASQPKAWLDILASANTTQDEKNEAMEEILILAKDKRRARVLLDEGILDSLLWILDRYFEKLDPVDDEAVNPTISPTERMAVKLAAKCCVTLGKTHCAAIHTEGDLQLMSLYERGTVPEERQVAQMFHEIPHHVRITKTHDPSIVEPSKEVFALRQLDLPQAEDLARSIMSVSNGNI